MEVKPDKSDHKLTNINVKGKFLCFSHDKKMKCLNENTVKTGVQAALTDKLHPEFGNSNFGKQNLERN